MQALWDFTANKSCPELSPDTHSLTDSLTNIPSNTTCSDRNGARSNSFPLLCQSSLDDSEPGLESTSNVTTTQDDVIEILSSHIEPEEDNVPNRSALVPIKFPNGEILEDSPSHGHRKSVARAIGAVTFLLLLFSVILIGISLNMSKNIDEMAGATSQSQVVPPPTQHVADTISASSSKTNDNDSNNRNNNYNSTSTISVTPQLSYNASTIENSDWPSGISMSTNESVAPVM